MEKRVIIVKGTGTASRAVDLVTISTTISSLDKNYENAFYQTNNKTNKFINALLDIGHIEEDIKTTDFNVKRRDERYEDARGNYKYRFLGFEVSHKIKIDFYFDKKFLSKTINKISATDVHSTLSFSFSVKDQDSLKKLVLKNAALNAKEKANILAIASGVSLGDVLKINYNWEEINFYSRSNFDIIANYNMDMDASINPEDVEVEDTVTIIYEIK